MKKQPHVNELFDRTLSEKEKQRIMENIKENEDLLEEYHLLHKLDSHLQKTDFSVPSPSFVDQVMQKVSVAEFYLPKTLQRQGLYLFTGVLICLFIMALFFDSLDSFTLFNSLKEITLFDRSLNLSSIVKYLNVNYLVQGLMFAAFILSMLVFDTVVLRPWFQKRRRVAR
ncbi:MAG: hypothetical protein OEY51_08765, partial [Cyclobacteriaceae bacterium]|nr:hypothetical protein [Cyclobacteriaceae bacterium]